MVHNYNVSTGFYVFWTVFQSEAILLFMDHFVQYYSTVLTSGLFHSRRKVFAFHNFTQGTARESYKLAPWVICFELRFGTCVVLDVLSRALSCIERRFGTCVVMDVPSSSPALTIHSVHFTLYCICSLPHSLHQFSTLSRPLVHADRQNKVKRCCDLQINKKANACLEASKVVAILNVKNSNMSSRCFVKDTVPADVHNIINSSFYLSTEGPGHFFTINNRRGEYCLAMTVDYYVQFCSFPRQNFPQKGSFLMDPNDQW